MQEEESISSSLVKLTRHSIIYGIGHILNRAVGFLLLPIYTNYIEPEDFGIAAFIFLFLALMTILYQLGFSQAFLRYFSLTKSLAERKKIFTNSFASLVLLSAAFSLLTYLFSDRISLFLFHTLEFRNLILISIGILIGDVLSQIPLIALRVEEKSFKYLFLTLAQVLLNVIFNVYFIVFLKLGIIGIFAANLISSIFILLLLLPYSFKYFSLKIDAELIKLLFLFGFPYMFSALAKVLMDLADRFLLERIMNFEIVGIYNAAYKLAGVMGLIVAGFRFAWMPYSLSIANRKDARRIYSLITTYFLLFSGWVLLGFLFFMEPIIKLKVANVSLFGEKYWHGLGILPLIMGAYVLYGLYSILIIGIYVKKRTKILPMITGIGALANILLNLIFIPKFGMYGAAWATLAAYLIMVFVIYWDTRNHFPIPFEYSRVLKLIVIYFSIFVLGTLTFFQHFFLLKLVLLIFAPIILFFWGFYHKEELDQMKNLITVQPQRHRRRSEEINNKKKNY